MTNWQFNFMSLTQLEIWNAKFRSCADACIKCWRIPYKLSVDFSMSLYISWASSTNNLNFFFFFGLALKYYWSPVCLFVSLIVGSNMGYVLMLHLHLNFVHSYWSREKLQKTFVLSSKASIRWLPAKTGSTNLLNDFLFHSVVTII